MLVTKRRERKRETHWLIDEILQANAKKPLACSWEAQWGEQFISFENKTHSLWNCMFPQLSRGNLLFMFLMFCEMCICIVHIRFMMFHVKVASMCNALFMCSAQRTDIKLLTISNCSWCEVVKRWMVSSALCNITALCIGCAVIKLLLNGGGGVYR